MGVTLERVQNKFACIIGELCGEPKILSQFAIWLDLRLAEYKSKGSISLECSGCVPEPSWLEGLIPSLPVMSPNPPSSFPRPTSSYTGSHLPRSHLGNSAVNKSADVAVKDEPPGDDSFAYIRQCAGFDSGLQLGCHTAGDTRKRAYPVGTESGAETCRISLQGPSGHREPMNSPVPVKRFRRSDLSSTLLTLSEGDADCPDMAILSSPHTNTPNAPLGEDSSQTMNGGQRPAVTSRLLEESLTEDLYNSREAIGSVPLAFRQSFDNQGGENLKMGCAENFEHQGNRLKGVFFPDGNDKSNVALGKSYSRTSSDLLTFYRWLRSRPNSASSGEKIESIPPAQLDPILADFFRTVKNRRGLDYDHKSLKYIRAGLERHLKAQNYPASITRSQCFHISQRAYKERKNQLRLAHLNALVE